MKERGSILRSVTFALAGLRRLPGLERNVRIELGFALLAVGLGLCLQIAMQQWLMIAVCCAGVLSAEAMNTAVEVLADTLHPRRDPGIGLAKDLAAAAVLLWVFAALVAGLFIFLPLLLARSGL